MNDRRSVDPEKDLIKRVKSLSNGETGVSYQDFERVVRDNAPSDIKVSGRHEITSFASNQLGHWQAEYFFSMAHDPNSTAQAEMAGWKIICRDCLEALKNRIPLVGDQLEKKHNLIVLQHSLKQAIDHNKSSPLRKFRAAALSRMSFAMDRIGFKSLAMHMYSSSLYPKGTVGRTQ